MLEKLEKVKQAAKLCTECNGVACRKCPYDEHNNGGVGVPMCGVVFATDVLAVIDFMEQAMQAKDADLLATSDKLTQEIEQLRQRPDVVRCKDCKHYDSETQSCLDGLDGIFQPDWYCADGERKDGDGEKSVEAMSTEEIEAFLREKEPFMFEWHDGGDDIY